MSRIIYLMMDVRTQKTATQNPENGESWIWEQTSPLDVSLWQTGETVVVEILIFVTQLFKAIEQKWNYYIQYNYKIWYKMLYKRWNIVFLNVKT